MRLFLSSLTPGAVATVAGFAANTPPEALSRFRALGFILGTNLIVERRLPFAGPIVVRLGGCAFALEQAAAACVLVTSGGAP